MIQVKVYYKGNPAGDVKVQTSYDNSVEYTNENGIAIFEDLPSSRRYTIYVEGKTVVDGDYPDDNGRFLVSLDFCPW